MNKLIFFVLLFNLYVMNLAHSEQKIAFINVDKIVFESVVGKKIDNDINQNFNKENEKLISLEKKIRSKESNILNKKNILSEEEFNKEVSLLREEISKLQNDKLKISKKYREIRVKQTNFILDKLNLILSKYVEENSISIVIRKKDIVIGKTNLDITNDILKSFNKNVTKIE